MIYLDRLMDSVRRSARRAGQPRATRESRLPVWGLLVLVASGLLSCRPEEPGPGATIASRGMVVSSNPLASQAGVDVMREGGNAIDAAVSVSFALAVVHPIAGNVGGGGFLLYHDAETGREISVDYREMAPAAAGRDMYLDAAGEVVPELSTVGYLASGVPGSVAGLHLAWSRFGTLPWSRLLEPAIVLARNGFVVEEYFSRSLESAVPLLERFDESRRIFLPGGSPPAPGQTFTQPDLARTLEAIARDGAEGFYGGEIAELIERDMEAHAGIMTREDLANYVARIRPPVRGRYRGCEVVSMGPPSSGGVILIEMLNMLELAGRRQDTTARFHLLAECMRRAFADRAADHGRRGFRRGARRSAPVQGTCPGTVGGSGRNGRHREQAGCCGAACGGVAPDHASFGRGSRGERGGHHHHHQRQFRFRRDRQGGGVPAEQ